jgi:hypothetical protein
MQVEITGYSGHPFVQFSTIHTDRVDMQKMGAERRNELLFVPFHCIMTAEIKAISSELKGAWKTW